MGRPVKSIKPTKTNKTDCFAYKPRECVALTKKNCDGCSFYKTKAEVEAAREKAMARISSLDLETQGRIATAYFDGDSDGAL